MADSLQSQIDAYLSHLDGLIQRGHKLRGRLAADPSDKPALAAMRVWQQDCALTVNQLSGGSKAHWLARAYSEAFLMRSTGGEAMEAASPDEIAGRIIHVLEQALHSLSQMREGEAGSASAMAAESPRRFDFVHNSELRPVVEQAYVDGRRALEEGRFDEALLAFCGILDAIVTDALQYKGLPALAAGAPAGAIGDWSFETRLAVAEKAGIIHSECARLPPIARRYRNLIDGADERSSKPAISEGDARQTGQVLRVVMRDLNPGR